MDFASYLIYCQYKTSKKAGQIAAKSVLALYVARLILNYAWTPIFFNLGQFWFALVVLLVMWLVEILILAKACKISRSAFYCRIPYLLWTTFAAYLNISIALLNQ